MTQDDSPVPPRGSSIPDDSDVPVGKVGTFRNPEKLQHLTQLRGKAHTKALEEQRYGRWEDDVNAAARNLEAGFTSTGVKSLHHTDRMALVRDRGEYHPVVLQIAPTDKCNLECHFCSTSHREGDEIPIDALRRCIDDFMEVGPLKAAEVTGGGDPTMYRDLPTLIDHLHGYGVDIGMITNGVALAKINEKNPGMLEKLTWLRISLAFLDAENYFKGANMIAKLDIPQIPGTLGLSYVWTDASTREKLERIRDIKEETGAAFVRIVPDCHNPVDQDRFKREIAPMIDEFFPGAFGQKKPYDIHYACRMGFIKPFLNPDGWLYHCSAAPLNHGKFNAENRAWAIGHMSEVKAIYPTGWRERRMDTSHCHAGMCFYAEQNRLWHSLETPVQHKNFI